LTVTVFTVFAVTAAVLLVFAILAWRIACRQEQADRAEYEARKASASRSFRTIAAEHAARERLRVPQKDVRK
jgi:Tfp pilus assembly protein PilO